MKKRKPCGGPFKAPVIHVDGRVTVCCRDVEMDLCLGNVNDEDFDKIWNNKKATKIRIAHIIGDLKEFPKCLHCNNLDAPIVSEEDIIKYLISINREDLIKR
jgi:radical SAM protein with 4Fe4S-binding SPASM domain